MKCPRSRGSSQELGQRGAILLMVSFMLLALMGILAIVIDMGIARATQVFLQVSADSAAVEGLRLRNGDLNDAVQSDLDRRMAAASSAALVFDEDLDEATGASEYLMGAGPQLETGVVGIDDPAGGLLVTHGPYLPELQLNAVANEPHGDLVAGTFFPRDLSNAGNPYWHAENGLYQRTDFETATAAVAPDAPAFLVRLRRTNDVEGLDNQPGVSSAGTTLPFLFGLGSGVLTSDDPGQYDPRRDGITVRGTAIADSRPAVAVGVMGEFATGVAEVGSDVAVPGVPRVLAIEDSSWLSDFVTDGNFEVTVARDGAIIGVPAGPTPGATGMAQPAPSIVRLGDLAYTTPSAGTLIPPVDPTGIAGLRYVVLYSDVAGVDRVTGFGAVEILSATLILDSFGDTILSLTGRKLQSIVAPENASAIPALATDLSVAVASDPLREPLLAPVIAR